MKGGECWVLLSEVEDRMMWEPDGRVCWRMAWWPRGRS
jgi:hypothetical protein